MARAARSSGLSAMSMSRPERSGPPIGVRWTIGDVSAYGFEALRLSIHGAWRLFGPDAAYAVCVNSIAVERAREAVGDVPVPVTWRDVTGEVPDFLRPHLDAGMAEGVGWKLAPPRIFPDRYELALDNDCILWSLPDVLRAWLEAAEPDRCIIAEDTEAHFGEFTRYCGPEPRNAGIRGLPPGYDFEAVVRTLLAENPARLAGEVDEQGLQVAALGRFREARVVPVDDVAICSPFPQHRAELGRCGAHFVGLNAHALPWDYYGRPAVECIREHWLRHRPALYERVGLRE
ncbi:MAG TPA: hypothetical protein VF188_01585 [Longimicrobiales bacterium]